MTTAGESQKTLKDRIEQIIAQIRPYIQGDGGDIELVDADETTGKVTIRFRGACRGCPMSAMTLKMGVERHVKERLPEVTEVVAVE